MFFLQSHPDLKNWHQLPDGRVFYDDGSAAMESTAALMPVWIILSIVTFFLLRRMFISIAESNNADNADTQGGCQAGCLAPIIAFIIASFIMA